MQLARAVIVQYVLERLRVTIEEVLVGHRVVRFVDVLQVREQRQARACSGKIGKSDATGRLYTHAWKISQNHAIYCTRSTLVRHSPGAHSSVLSHVV